VKRNRPPVLADLDNTLIRSERLERAAWGALGERCGVEASIFDALGEGLSAVQRIARAAPWLDAGSEAAWLHSWEIDHAYMVEPYSGADELLALGLVGIVTNTTKAVAEAKLRASGLPVPSVLVAADVVAPKPSPAGYLLAAELLGAVPAAAVAVDDAKVGIVAAVAAGIGTVVGVTTTTAPDELMRSGAHRTVPDIAAFLVSLRLVAVLRVVFRVSARRLADFQRADYMDRAALARRPCREASRVH